MTETLSHIERPELQAEQVSKAALHDAFAEYALYSEFDWRIPQLDVATEEAIKQEVVPQILEEFGEKHDLLETLGDIEDRESALTVAIPIEILRENHETVLHTIEHISIAQQNLQKPVDIVIWANTRYIDHSSWEEDEYGEEIFVPGANNYNKVQAQAETHLVALKELLWDCSTSELRIQTALELYSQKDASMSLIRSDQMKAIAVNVLQSGADFLHPVLWLDADTVSLDKDALQGIESAVRNGDTLFPHLAIEFAPDWIDDRSIDEQDDATKVVAVYEYIRQIEVALDWKAGYYEEAGLAFALGTYLACGGVRENDTVNESEHLLRGVEEARSRHGDSIIPEALIGHSNEVESKGYTQNTVGVSARRFYETVKQEGLRGLLAERIGDGSDYQLFSDLQRTDSGDAIVRKSEIYSLLNVIVEQKQAEAKRAQAFGNEAASVFTDEQLYSIKELIERLFPD